MRTQQLVRVVFLRLSIACSTFIVGVYAHTFMVAELSTKIDMPEVVVTRQAQITGSQTNNSFVKLTRKLPSPFDPSGDYHPSRQITAGSERFIQFVLEVRRRKQKLVAWGHVPNVDASYKFISVVVTEKQLKFRTQKIKGVHYTFNGRFVGEGNFSEQYSGHAGSVMLEGTLQKFVNGQKVFEINTPFVHYPGC